MAAMPTVVTTANTNSIDGVIGGSATPASTPAPKKAPGSPGPSRIRPPKHLNSRSDENPTLSWSLGVNYKLCQIEK